MSENSPYQCLICGMWFHYDEDKPVCRTCYVSYKEWEYTQPVVEEE